MSNPLKTTRQAGLLSHSPQSFNTTKLRVNRTPPDLRQSQKLTLNPNSFSLIYQTIDNVSRTYEKKATRICSRPERQAYRHNFKHG